MATEWHKQPGPKIETRGAKEGFMKSKYDPEFDPDTDDYKNLFRYNLVRFMKKYNMSCLQVSKALDMSIHTAYHWRKPIRKGGGMPSSENMKYLCILFDCDIADFFKRERE